MSGAGTHQYQALTFSQAREYVRAGANWLDVRDPSEYSRSGLPNAINVPWYELLLRLDELDENQRYVCYCDDGRDSVLACFLLANRGFKVSVLEGGLSALSAA
jgi:Rhodanese-related sulfurtransferase